MNKNAGIIGLSVVLLLSIVSIVGLVSENNTLKKEVAELNATIDDATNQDGDQEDAAIDNQKKAFIQAAFHTVLNYTNDNYTERLDEKQRYFTAESYALMQGVGNDQNPSVAIKSTTENERVYQSAEGDNQFIYAAEVHYQVVDNDPVIIEYLYQLDLLERNKDYRIDNIEVIAKQPTVY